MKKIIIEVVKKIVKKIADETFKSNKDGKVPFIISENDLCCELYRQLYRPRKYTLTTECTCTIEPEKRYDLVIFDKKEAEYKLRKNGMTKNLGIPEKLSIRKLIAVFELKTTWSETQKAVENNFEIDIKKFKGISDCNFFIYFDFAGRLTEEKVNSFKQEGITIIYANIKDKKLYIVNQ